MAVSNFKFVSPGVFINEIDNSFIPKSADAIGPVVIGRSSRGLAMQPIKVQAYSDFVEMFGDTVPGMGGGDIYRAGNFQSPMYGTFAASAFLRANVAPLTYIRLLGQQASDNDGSAAGMAGWKTVKDPGTTVAENGGAFGLFVFPSASASGVNLGSGRLGAIWYLNQTASIALSGALYSAYNNTASVAIAPPADRAWGIGKAVRTDSANNFIVEISSSAATAVEKLGFNFDSSDGAFIRKVFNTNPQLTSVPGAFYPAASAKDYWLGESYRQEMDRRSLVGVSCYGVILPIANNTTVTLGPSDMKIPSREAVAGWFIGQDLGAASAFQAENMQKLFRLKGRGHGEWLNKNCKVSIGQIRESSTTVSDYGTFSMIIRSLSDTDSNIQVMERFDNLTLDPASPNFIAKVIGDQYTQWDTTNKMLKTYGEFANNSKFVYVEMNPDVEAGATPEVLLPAGYFGPPRFANVSGITGSYSDPVIDNTMIWWPEASLVNGDSTAILSGSDVGPPAGALPSERGTLSGSLRFPDTLLRVSASDAGLSNANRAFFGMVGTRTLTSTVFDPSMKSYFRLLTSDFPNDPTSYGASQNPAQLSGCAAWGYMFSMNDLKKDASSGQYAWASGSRSVDGNAVAFSIALTDGYRQFTAPFWGGFDGFNIQKPDPMYNAGMTEGTSTEQNDYEYHTWKRAINTVADPEFIDMNLLVAPGLTLDSLTTHMVRTCEERADALALIDLPSVYIPAHEAYYSSKASRIGTTPASAASALKNRMMDSSYGCTFYPWVQTRDTGNTGRMLWIPPSVAMMGVLASSEKSSELWFAPAGFNRGGLSDGAAGIPITSVTERLTSKNRDTLYDANINPIASFPSTGIVVFGQKTLQERQSALDRINVRRLVIYLKKQISILSSTILFDQNVQDTWDRFKALIEPLLDSVKIRYGITDYRLILDESTTTPDLIDQNILYAKIMVKPARAIEFIAIDFVIMSTGASFDD